MAKICKIILNIIFVLLIIVLGVYVFFRFTNKVEIYNVKTGSMEDNIHVGDYILIFKKSDYTIGDVVTYKKDNYYITHRIVKDNNDGNYITKGDANNVEDEMINEKDIVGKVMISGGILNIIVNYKYVLVAFFFALYLLSCYFGKEDKVPEILDDTFDENVVDVKEENDSKDINVEEKDIIKIDELKSLEDNNVETKEEQNELIKPLEENEDNKLEEKNDNTKEVKEIKTNKVKKNTTNNKKQSNKARKEKNNINNKKLK